VFLRGAMVLGFERASGPVRIVSGRGERAELAATTATATTTTTTTSFVINYDRTTAAATSGAGARAVAWLLCDGTLRVINRRNRGR